MRTAVRAIVGTILALAALLALGALTRAGYTARDDGAELRLEWRARVPRVEVCRTPTAEEQADLPVHMRQAEICEGRAVSYRLEVRVDGELRHRSVVEATGARGDRPMYVLHTVPLEPGPHQIRVVFERGDTATAESGELTALPPRVVLDRRLRVGAREVALVTYDPDARRLVLIGGGEE